MVEKDILEEKMEERKEQFEEAEIEDEEVFEEELNEDEAFEEETSDRKYKYQETKEKGKIYSEKIANDLSKSVEDFKESVRKMQKVADDKINEYKNATVSNLPVDLVESDDIYYLRVAVPGLAKEDVDIEAGDNDITITATFKPFIEELEELEDAKVIASEMTVGKCSKTVRFENSIELDGIKAKYSSGIVLITIPKLIIPKHKVTVE